VDDPARAPLARSFERHLRAENRSERTVATYLIGLRQAEAFLRARGTTVEAASRADLEAFMGDLLIRRAPSTAATYYKVLKLLYAWLAQEEEIPADPMARMRPPIVPDKPVPIVPEDALKRLFQVCAGNTFEARRDTALLMLLLDTGARRAELADLQLADVDLDLDVLLVLGKGRRERSLPFGRRAGEALDRYLRACARHKHAVLPWLWLGQQGRLTDAGLRMMLRRRGGEAGIPGLHAHQTEPQLRARVACPGRYRDRSHTDRRLEVPRDAPALRRQCGRCSCPRGSPPAVAHGPAVGNGARGDLQRRTALSSCSSPRYLVAWTVSRRRNASGFVAWLPCSGRVPSSRYGGEHLFRLQQGGRHGFSRRSACPPSRARSDDGQRGALQHGRAGEIRRPQRCPAHECCDSSHQLGRSAVEVDR
jgi:site-specific recombinase XerD